jgi:acyl carrier protein
MSQNNIKDEIRGYIKNAILQDDNTVIENDTPLISGGIIDSISTLKMVDFLEKKYKIEFSPHEVDRENLDTIDLIAQFVLSKK